MAKRMKLDGLGASVFGGEEPPAEEGAMTEGTDPLADPSLLDPEAMGLGGGEEMPLEPGMEQMPPEGGDLADLMSSGEEELDPSMMGGEPGGDLSQLSDEELMAIIEGGDAGGMGGVEGLGPQVDMLEGGLESGTPEEQAMIQQDLAMAARKRMAGI